MTELSTWDDLNFLKAASLAIHSVLVDDVIRWRQAAGNIYRWDHKRRCAGFQYFVNGEIREYVNKLSIHAVQELQY